jgi:hypothetical protein
MKNQMREERQRVMYSYISQWKESGLSQKQYCLENKISSSNFFYWYKKYRKQNNPVTGFIPVHVHQRSEKPSDVLEIIYPNGVRVQISGAAHPSVIGELIRMF